MATENNNPIPRSPRSEVINFGNAHKNLFVSNAAALGLQPGAAAAYKAAVDKLVDTINKQEEAKNAYRSLTTETDKAFSELLTVQGDTIRSIRAFAETSANPQAVYSLAQIPPVASPSPADPPGQPTNLTVSLDSATGYLNLKWKCQNPEGTQGTSYIVKRRLPGQTEFTFVGVTGQKKFTDATFTAGPDSVEYTVQAQRANLSGAVSEIFVVNFGRVSGGGLAAIMGENKKAA